MNSSFFIKMLIMEIMTKNANNETPINLVSLFFIITKTTKKNNCVANMLIFVKVLYVQIPIIHFYRVGEDLKICYNRSVMIFSGK